jgi:hypothetical protein
LELHNWIISVSRVLQRLRIFKEVGLPKISKGGFQFFSLPTGMGEGGVEVVKGA